jgi:hypothetical protein
VSLLVTALLVGGGALAAGIAARIAVRRRRATPAPAEAVAPEPTGSELARAGFELELGDVA